MPHSFWLMIATTPWWLYLLLYYLLSISFLATKPRLVNIKPMYYACMPLIIFTFIACYIAPPSHQALILALPLFLIGSLYGVTRAKWQGIRAVAELKRIFLPGSWLMFIVIIGIFGARQYVTFKLDINLLHWIKTHGHDYLLPLYAFSIGICTSQLVYFRHLLQRGPFITQEELKALNAHTA